MASKQNWTFDIDRLSEAVNGLQKCLECTICLDLMTTPVKTRCGHSFCQTCIGNVMRRNAFCPLCKESLNKRSISKDDHLESCIQKFKKLMIVIETDSHIDVLSHSKQPRDTRESCSNSGSSQSSVSHKRKQTKRQSMHSNQSTFKTERPSTSWRTIIDCNNPQYDANSMTQLGYDQTSSTLTGIHPFVIDGNDNTLYDSSDIKVRTWIHSLDIENEPAIIAKDIEDATRPSEESTSQMDKDTKRSQPSDVKKTDSDSSKLKYNTIHAKVRMKDQKKSAVVEKSEAEERVGSSRDGSSLATSSNQTRQVDVSDRSISHASTVGDKPSSVDTNWSRVKEIGKEMRGKTKKMKKLSVSTEKSISKSTEKYNESIEKNNEKRKEKNTETSNKNKSVPRIIEDIMLSTKRKYESLHKSATNDDMSNKEANISKQLRESNSCKQDAIDMEPGSSNAEIKTEASVNETTLSKLEESFANDKVDFSMSEANSQSAETSLVVTLTEGEKLRIKNLNSRQMNEIIGFEVDSKELVDDANILDRKYLMKEDDKEQEGNVGIMTELLDSPSSQRQRLIILTPEKLNESVEKRRANHDSDLRTPVKKLVNPKDQTPHVNNDVERTTTSKDVQLQSQTPNMSRLSLKRNPKTTESPPFSQIPLKERFIIKVSSKSHKSVDSSVSNDSPSFHRLATVKRRLDDCDFTSQISDKDRPPTNQATTVTSVSSENTTTENNKRNIDGIVRQDKKLFVKSTKSEKLKHINNRTREEGCSYPVKFTQLGTLIRRRNVKYYYLGAIKHERRLPGKIRVTSVYNMQQSDSKSEIQHRTWDRLHSLELSPTCSNSQNSQDSTGVTVVENAHYVHKSAANLDNTVLEATKLTYGVPASSTPKANADRRRAETTARRSPSMSVINKPSIAEEAPRSPRTPRADQSATQQRTPQGHSRTTNSIKLLSPEKDSQLKFLTIDSPMSQRGQSRLASSTRPAKSELERDSASIKGNLAEVRDSQRTVTTFESFSGSSGLEPAKKRKRNNDDDDDSSISAVSVSSQCTVKLNNNKKESDKSPDKTSSHSNTGKKCHLSSSRDRGDEVICLDSDDCKKAYERKFKRVFSISDSDSESESPARVPKKSNRNKSDDRCDQGNASITSTSKRRKSAKRASDEDLRIRNIVNKWSNEHNAAQKKSSEGTRSVQDTVNPTRLTSEEKTTQRRSSFSTISTEGEKRSSAKLSEKNTESDLFFESNSLFNSEGLEQLATHQSDERSSRSQKRQESPSSMDFLADDIINKVLQINRSKPSNPGACRSTSDDGTSQRGKGERHEYNLLQDNFDEIIANVELPQSEDVIPCSELPAHRNPDRNLNRTLTEQNTSSCPVMMNESRDVTRHGQMKPASSTADIFEYCGYSGKSAKKAYPSNTSGNSDKENTVSHRKHDHAEEDRRDKKNVATRNPDAVDKAGREKIASKNNVSQEKRGPFDRVEVIERTPRKEKEINVPAGSVSRADDDSRVQGKASDDNQSNAKDLSSSEYDSLMNITLHQARLKMIEEDLFGVAPAQAGTKASKASLDDSLSEGQRTPKRKRGAHASSQGHSAEEDDIVENTPETKMRNSGSNGKTVSSDTRRNIETLNLSPIPSFSEQPSSTTSDSRKRAKREHANTPLYQRNLMCPLYQSTPKVTSSSMTSSSVTTGHRDDVSTACNKRQLNEQRATTSGVVSSSTKRTADGNMSRNVCQQPDMRKLRFVCTGLSATQIANVQRFTRQHNADYTKQFDPSVTHVIVNTSGVENAAKSTLKYLQGIAHCKWVVSYKWIEDCIDERRLLPEPLYEATTQSADINGPGPRNSRLSHKGLFENFTFLCIGPYDNVSLSQYQDLLRATGATVVSSLPALAAEKKGLKGVVIQGDTHGNNIIESWYRDARAGPILIDWIVECIGHYRLFPLIPYIQTLSPQDYCAIGYPRDIIGEEEYSDASE